MAFKKIAFRCFWTGDLRADRILGGGRERGAVLGRSFRIKTLEEHSEILMN
jgi:hypothetical protein